MKYIVLEIQTGADGAVGNIATAHEELNDAYARFHGVLAAAAVSELPLHAASLLQSDGRLLDCRSFEHARPEPEPEPETEPEPEPVAEEQAEASEEAHDEEA